MNTPASESVTASVTGAVTGAVTASVSGAVLNVMHYLNPLASLQEFAQQLGYEGTAVGFVGACIYLKDRNVKHVALTAIALVVLGNYLRVTSLRSNSLRSNFP